MTDSGVLPLPLRDEPARERIATDLDVNLLVEAGAGSGKTTALVGRMVALIATGRAGIDEIAAVTFTRKAAAELRERFQMKIELRLGELRTASIEDAGDEYDGPAEDADLERERLGRALDEIDRAFIGTIHSFCGRLLRERPLDVGLDPAFEELPVEERVALRRGYWEAFLERLARESDPILEELSRAGLRPANLFILFDTLVENPDVDFPAEALARPSMTDVGVIRADLEGLIDRAWELMDDMPPAKGWDSLQDKLRKLHFEREITGWTEAADLFEAVALLCKPKNPHKTTFNRWRDKEMTRSLVEDINAFGVGATPAQRLVDRWYAHRYALAIRLCRTAARQFQEHRVRVGRLDFQDLLVLAARLLRENPTVRQQLGGRYRRLLVDEFQDTDPLQAEIMLLLSAEPVAEGERTEGSDPSDWRIQVPRPGALFVVGDPKQSIYRFRRADIQLYGFVRERFEVFGDVLTLSTNFRSRPSIGDVVNDVFDDDAFFPHEATAEQAAFERLDTRPPVDAVPCEGVFTYRLAPDHRNKGSASTDDAARIAGWIGGRVERGERRPEDFLILTRGRGQITAYANALEAHGLPVQVTGAGVGVESEIQELKTVLRCMIDPANPVNVVAALVGLFFGMDYERLVQHRLDGGGFDAMAPGERGHPDVVEALRRLHGWWRASSSEPADVFIGRLVSEMGLLPLSAAGELGALRAGALLYALDTVREAALAGDTSLPGALAALDAALDLKEAEAPLEPGRSDAIRLMNLHQAKGLEGTVVVLADPTEHRIRVPDSHMTRSVDGTAEGFLRVSEARGGFKGSQDLARPVGWGERQAAEQAFAEAEEVRLLYVAVTRAREELVVAQWPEGRGSSAWAPLHAWLDQHAETLTLDRSTPSLRDELSVAPEQVRASVAEAAAALQTAGTPTYARATVTSLAKGRERPSDASASGSGAGGATADVSALRGFAWGSAVHGALALAATNPAAEILRSGCRDLLVEHQRPLDERGEPIELLELLGLVRTVRESELWARAQAADRRLVEIPFALPGLELETAPEPIVDVKAADETGKPQLDLFGGGAPRPTGVPALEAEARDTEEAPTDGSIAPTAPSDSSSGGVPTVIEGVIDLAFRERGGWVIADYKTDVGTDSDFAVRAEGYRRQVDLYAQAWKTLTGEPVKERVLFYTTQGRVESW